MLPITTLAILFASLFVARASSKIDRMWVFSPAVLMIAYITLIILPGKFLERNSQAAMISMVSYLLWVAGMLLGVLAYGAASRKSKTASSDTRYLTIDTTVCWALVLLSVPAIAITFASYGRVPLLIGISSVFGDDGGISMHKARQMNTILHAAGETKYFGQGYLKQIYTVVSPVFISAIFIKLSNTTKTMHRHIAQTAMILLIFASALNGQIWVPIYVMILFIIVKHYTDRRNDIGLSITQLVARGLIAYASLIGFVFAYRYFQYLNGRHFGNFFTDTAGRIFSPGVNELFVIFPDVMPFRLGSTWWNDIRGILPGPIESFAYEVHYLVNGGDWGYTLSPGVVASSYVNFGFAGVFFTSFVATTVFTNIYYKLIRSKEAVLVAMGLYTSQVFMLSIPSDVSSYLVLVLTLLFMYGAYRVANYIHVKARAF